MLRGDVLHLLVLASLLSAPLTSAEFYRHVTTVPQAPVLEIGTNFTAMCIITNTTEITADNLSWSLAQSPVPREQYTRINATALNVTIPITSDTPLLLLCQGKTDSHILNKASFQHGIFFKKGYRPAKPENLSCMAVQENSLISPTIRCEWVATGRSTDAFPTIYHLFIKHSGETYNVSTSANQTQMVMDIFPNHVYMDIWVEASNPLGRIESEHLSNDANAFVKTKPPSGVQVISEQRFPSSLLVNWTRPIRKEYLLLIYQIRYIPVGSHSWNYVPLEDTSTNIQSFRLQNFQPDTLYTIQVRCKYFKEGQGYWSDWSNNATKATPEEEPWSKADVWRIVTVGARNERQVQFVSKDPESANGRIRRFDIRIQNQRERVKNGSLEWESVPVNRSKEDPSSAHRGITFLKNVTVPNDKSVKVLVIAFNSVGKSPEASLGIPAKARERAPMQQLKVWPQGGVLWAEWTAVNGSDVSEYVVEWVHKQVDWKRENSTSRRTAIRGPLEKFVCYEVSVYPLYSGWVGKPVQMQAYLEQGVPSQAPEALLKGDPGRNEVTLVWEEIPKDSRRGFITHYQLFYTYGADIRVVMLPANATSYTLRSLSANTKYDVWLSASTIRGSKTGSKSSFTTLKYAPGEIEGVVVGVSLGFLFIFLITMLLCLCKRDMIKKNLWPQIPDPGESTIGNWSPDYPLKVEAPRDSSVSGVSVLDVEVCESRSVFEESSPALKKDKFLSEEHSSGIGGSSCMSSPRQSVSDSDEGDPADSTASTVQYSSVVASSGYKGQMPSAQAPQALFSRSESTQPLLDCEENADLQEASRQSQCFPTQPHPQQEGPASLDFCPLEEDGQKAEWRPAASSYMPQLGGYRPQ